MSVDKLKEDIALKQKELADLEKSMLVTSRLLAIKDLSEFTVDEKVKLFDSLYNQSVSIVEQAEKEKYLDEDASHWTFEAMMEIIARDKKEFWKYLNNINHR